MTQLKTVENLRLNLVKHHVKYLLILIIASNAFCRSFRSILVYIPLSKPFKILPLRNDRNRSVEWLLLKPDWYFIKCCYYLKNIFVCFCTTFSMTLKVMAARKLVVNLRRVFRHFLIISLTFANLKAPGNLNKDIKRLQISVTGLAGT